MYAPTTMGTLLREFTGGHVRQLQAVQSRHLLALADRTPVLDGIGERAFVDIDSLLRPVYGHAKQGASFGHTKIAGKQVLRRGLYPLATTISTPKAAPVVAGIRLWAGRAGSGRGAASMVTEAINTAKVAGATDILVRGDAAYGSSAVINAALRAKVTFSLVLTRQPSVNRAIDKPPHETSCGTTSSPATPPFKSRPDHPPPATPGPTGTSPVEKLDPQASRSRTAPAHLPAGNPAENQRRSTSQSICGFRLRAAGCACAAGCWHRHQEGGPAHATAVTASDGTGGVRAAQRVASPRQEALK